VTLARRTGLTAANVFISRSAQRPPSVGGRLARMAPNRLYLDAARF